MYQRREGVCYQFSLIQHNHSHGACFSCHNQNEISNSCFNSVQGIDIVNLSNQLSNFPKTEECREVKKISRGLLATFTEIFRFKSIKQEKFLEICLVTMVQLIIQLIFPLKIKKGLKSVKDSTSGVNAQTFQLYNIRETFKYGSGAVFRMQCYNVHKE